MQCYNVVLLLQTAEHDGLQLLLITMLITVSPADTDEVVA